jgi:hypothetical protein
MNELEIIILIGLVVAMATGVGYFLTKEQPTLKEITKDYQNNEEIQEVVQLAKELYNKDLRPVVAKKAPKETKSEFPIEQPAKKKRKYYPKKKKTEDK